MDKNAIIMILAIPVALLLGMGGVAILVGGDAIFNGIIYLGLGLIGALILNSRYEKS